MFLIDEIKRLSGMIQKSQNNAIGDGFTSAIYGFTVHKRHLDNSIYSKQEVYEMYKRYIEVKGRKPHFNTKLSTMLKTINEFNS